MKLISDRSEIKEGTQVVLHMLGGDLLNCLWIGKPNKDQIAPPSPFEDTTYISDLTGHVLPFRTDYILDVYIPSHRLELHCIKGIEKDTKMYIKVIDAPCKYSVKFQELKGNVVVVTIGGDVHNYKLEEIEYVFPFNNDRTIK